MLLRSTITVVILFNMTFVSSYSFGQTRGSDVPGYYDESTGNLTIDTTNVFDGEVAGYSFSADICCSPGFRFSNHTPFMGTSFFTSIDDFIGESNFSGVEGGVYSLGDVLPVGLSSDELSSLYFHEDEQTGNDGGPGVGKKHYVLGGIGSNVYHVIDPVYSSTPFPALNDGSVGPAQSVNWAEQASLLYNAESGELLIDLSGDQGGAIWSYRITLENNASFNVDAFTPATSLLAASVSEEQVTEVGFSNIEPGLYNLGSILPAGMTEGELTTSIRSARFIGEPGHDVVSLDIGLSGSEMAVRYAIPEPSTGLLSALAAMLFFLFRNRGSNVSK